MPVALMAHDADPRAEKLAEIGDISGFELFHNQVLCAVYLRPQKTKSGIYLTDSTLDEDKYQSKVGLVVKMGPSAFVDPEGKWFRDIKAEMNDWAVFRPSESWSVTVNGVLCRILDDINIRGRVAHPDQVY